MQNYFWKCVGAYLIGWAFAQIVRDLRASFILRTLIFFGGLTTVWLLLKASEWYKAKRKGAK
ncbi:hypothetical protein ES703_08211 [subsurface metagenome]